ncbi:MAG: NAD-binding protein, partial [Deltaproteobacteria bacterium]|nr:NAD-binding protein [Deltaproteobacteria bacterium]
MNQVVFIGGGLQGVEAAYLARKIGWRVRLIDRNPTPPASGLVDEFIQMDLKTPKQLDRLTAGTDLGWPNIQNDAALYALAEWADMTSRPPACAPRAY